MHVIMNKDIPTIIIENGTILNYNLCPKSLLVKGLGITEIYQWLSNRALPSNRVNADKVYQVMGLPRDSFMNLLYTTHGLSINDNFWIADENEIGKLRYKDINLFENSLSKAMYLVALRGDYNFSIQADIRSAEFTGQGTYPKCFIRRNDGIYMCKHEVDKEITNEVISAYIAKILGLNSVDYRYEVISGLNCVVSKIESNINQNWENAFDIAKHIQDNYGLIPQEFAVKYFGRQYTDLAVFDALVLNDDRHMKNWAFSIDPDTGEFIGIAPSYDYNKTFLGTKGSMSQLIFDGNRMMNILNAGRFAIENYGTNLRLDTLFNNLDKIPNNINRDALKKRILYITGNSLLI